MKQTLLAIIVVLAVAGTTTAINGEKTTFASVEAFPGAVEATCDGDQQWGGDIPAMMLLVAQSQGKGKDTCLEGCANTRQRCEQEDKHQPGSRENVTWSKQCQGEYMGCMDACK